MDDSIAAFRGNEVSLKDRLERLRGALNLDPAAGARSNTLVDFGLVPASSLSQPTPGLPRQKIPGLMPEILPDRGPILLTKTYPEGSLPFSWTEDLRSLCCGERIPLRQLDRRVEDCGLADLIFLDTETTGLSGGAGTLAFLVGLVWIEDEFLHLEQYLMKDLPDEIPMLEAVSRRLARATTLVTYNGKAFDLPLLDNRMVINRLPPMGRKHHVDLLFLARRFWKRRIRDCSLRNVETHLLDLEREDDIPPHLIPRVFFQYVQAGDLGLMSWVLEHNRQDLLSLVGVLKRTLQLALSNPGVDAHPIEDFVSLAKHWENLGDTQRALGAYRRLLLEPEVHHYRVGIYRCLGDLLKKAGAWEEATQVWRQMIEEAPHRSIYPYEELAKYYEHRGNSPLAALELTKKALSLGSGIHGTLHTWPLLLSQLNRRKQRLEQRLSRRSCSRRKVS